MINQEDIFQAIQKQNWNYLISILHKFKKDIATDSLLTHAAKTFVSEFLRQVDSYPTDRIDIIENLEKLWIIDQGKYYKLEPNELKSVTCQIVKRKKDKLVEAYNYAKRLAREEGIFVGISTGAALAAVAKKLPEIPKGSKILTFNYDTGERYLSVEGLFE